MTANEIIRSTAVVSALALLSSSCASEDGFTPVSDAMLQSPADADWPMWRRTLDGRGYSPLAQITPANVGDLTLAWSQPIGTGIQEPTPIVYDGLMFVPNHSDYIQAFAADSGEPGDESWGDVPLEERWHVGTWMVPSYDAELDTIYIGTSVTIPAPKFTLGGNDLEHLYHNSTLALDADTGELKWHYQHVVDHWDLDHPFERMLVDTRVAPSPDEVPWINPNLANGELRRVITGVPGKTGLVYTLDRETGEFLWARPTVTQNVITGIDPATGKAHVDPNRLFTHAGQQLTVCPGTNGGKNWPAGAYDPATNAMYVPMQNMCMNAQLRTGERDPSLVYGFSTEYIVTPGTENIGAIWAISVETGKLLWRHEQRAGMMSLVTTGGGVVFGGDVAGTFQAFDAHTGDVLWEENLGTPVSGFPISFAVDGRQYIAVATGQSLVASAARTVAPELPAADAAARIFVFALSE